MDILPDIAFEAWHFFRGLVDAGIRVRVQFDDLRCMLIVYAPGADAGCTRKIIDIGHNTVSPKVRIVVRDCAYAHVYNA